MSEQTEDAPKSSQGEDVGEDNKMSVHVAIQAYDYEIERGASVLPARRRIIPIKFRDFHDPDEIDDENKDKDFLPSNAGMSPVKTPRVHRIGGKRGRPRKIPRDHAYANGKNGDSAESSATATDPKPANWTADSQSTANETQTLTAENSQDEGTSMENDKKNLASDVINSDALVRPRPYKCDCGLSFQRLASLKKHKWQAHKDDKEETKAKAGKVEPSDMPRPYKCNMCEKRFGQKGNLKVHMRTHTGEKPFKCDMENCGKCFRSNESLRRHKLAHLGIKLYECEICKKKFSSNVALKEHISRHSDSRPYECLLCHKRFRQVSCYKRHLVTHSSELPHKCDICGKGFSQNIYLKSHMRSHTGERPYTCEICGKSFAHASDKTRHKSVHTGEKKFACEVCGSRFSDPSTCRRHVREHTGHKPYLCQLCGESFKRSGQLKAHLNKKHVHFKDETGGKTTALHFADGKFTTIHGLQELAQSQPTIIVNSADICGDQQEVITQIVQEQIQAKNSQSGAEQVQIIQSGQSLLNIGDKHILVPSSENQLGGKENQTILDTQRILEQIQSQIDPTKTELVNQDGQPVQVAYQIIHDDENQQIVEIQYHPVTSSEQAEEVMAVQEHMVVSEGSPTVTEQVLPPTLANQSPEEQSQGENVGLLTVDQSLAAASDTENQAIHSELKEDSTLGQNALQDYAATDDFSSEETTKNQAHSILSTDVTLEYIANPDFNSQEYYNWLSNFTEVCKQVHIPLDVVLFQRISQVHKTLSDILATPKGVLSNRDNFRILMSISKDLNEIISQHLNYVLLNLDDKTE